LAKLKLLGVILGSAHFLERPRFGITRLCNHTVAQQRGYANMGLLWRRSQLHWQHSFRRDRHLHVSVFNYYHSV